MGLSNQDRGFLRSLFFFACLLAFIPSIFIPWNDEIWIDDWHYEIVSSGFFLRALKVLLIAVSVIAWVKYLYLQYISNNNDNENGEN